MDMNSIISYATIAVGAWLVYCGYRLITTLDLRSFYDPKSYDHIPDKNRKEYAKGLGKILCVFGIDLIITNVLFFFKGDIIFNIAMFFLILGLLGTIIAIVILNKKYEK